MGLITAKELAKLAKVDNISEYGMEMLVAGTSMSKESMKEIINQDKKVWVTNEKQKKERWDVCKSRTVRRFW